MTVTLDEVAIEELLHGLGGPVMNHVELTAHAIEAVAASLAPVGEEMGQQHLRDTGEVVPAHGVATVVFTSPHALYVEEDTRPHIIRAKNSPVLVFYWGKVGKTVFLPFVNHPGTTGQHFLTRAAAIVAGAPFA